MPLCLSVVLLACSAALAAPQEGPARTRVDVHVTRVDGLTPSGRPSRSPADGVRVTVTRVGGAATSKLTDSHGRAHLRLAPGRYRVTVSSGGDYEASGPQTVTLRGGGHRILYFTLACSVC
jgi:Carboxypeptidase regulatory-like domain